jgi:hypothetical protein
MRVPQFTDQPNAYAELGRQALLWALGMGFIHLNETQQILTLSLWSALLAVFVWRSVVPTATIQEAGHSVTEIKQRAAASQKADNEDRRGTGDGSVPPRS